MNLKCVVKSWDSNQYMPFQNLVVQPILPWEQLEVLTNVSEILKIYGPTKVWTRTYCLRKICPNRTIEAFFSVFKLLGKHTLI